MIKFIKTAFSDIVKGKNIGLYFTILMALLLPVLNFIKIYEIQDVKLFFSFVLVVLGFILAKLVEKNWLLEKLEASHNKNEGVLQEIKTNNQRFPCNILPTWNATSLMDNLRNIKQNVVLVQSWFPDASILADAIVHSLNKGNMSIKVDIYMLDPELPFGAQRLCEVNDKINDFKDRDLIKLKEEYLQRFNFAVTDFTNRFNNFGHNVKFCIRVYPSMPTLKVYCIDNDYYFGWLGIDGGSTNNVCFHVADNSNHSDSHLAVVKIKKHIDKLSKISRVIESNY